MDNFQSNYDRILEILKSITGKESFLPQIEPLYNLISIKNYLFIVQRS